MSQLLLKMSSRFKGFILSTAHRIGRAMVMFYILQLETFQMSQEVDCVINITASRTTQDLSCFHETLTFASLVYSHFSRKPQTAILYCANTFSASKHMSQCIAHINSDKQFIIPCTANVEKKQNQPLSEGIYFLHLVSYNL